MTIKKFQPLKVSSKFPICALPLRLDSYNTCTYNCKYCYSNNRLIGERDTESIPNYMWLKNKFSKVYDLGDANRKNFLECLLKDRITLHGGSHCDLFQPLEKKHEHTKRIVELCNEYSQKILFSTKTDNLYDVPLNPALHSFQLSFSSTDDKLGLEENVPSFEKRHELYKELLDKGFRVGIRIQPYIPNVTQLEEIVDTFEDAVHFTVEHIKFVPGNPINDELIKVMGLENEHFTNLGLLISDAFTRYNHYMDSVVPVFEDKGLSYSIADNDLHYLGNNDCCCGDGLVSEVTHFNNTELLHRFGLDYDLDTVFELGEEYLDCRCSSLFNSDRRNGCVSFSDFYEDRFDRSSSVFSPKFQYRCSQSRLF